MTKDKHFKTFILKFALFITLIAVSLSIIGIIIYPSVVELIASGEVMGFDDAVQYQQSHPNTQYMAYYETPYRGNWQLTYKLALARERQSPVVMISSSRGYSYRSILFNNPDDFTNLGQAGFRLWFYEDLLNHVLNDYQPETIILMIDQGNLLFEIPPQTIDPSISTYNVQHLLEIIPNNLTDSQLRSEPSTPLLIENPDDYDGLGLGWQIFGLGFRLDGSMLRVYHIYPTSRVPDAEDIGNLAFEQQIQYLQGTTITEQSLNTIARILELTRSRGIEVIGFFPPYAQSVTQFMQNNEKYAYLEDAGQKVADLFAQYGYHFADFTFAELPFGDEHAFDGFHLDESVALATFQQLLEVAPEPLEEYTSVDHLSKLASMPTPPLAPLSPIATDD